MSKKETDNILRISGEKLFQQKRDVLKCTLSADLGLGGGIPRGSTVLIGGRPKLGKALSNDSPLLYKDGWKKIGDARVGDEICGSDGNFHKITGVFPQGVKSLRKVIFSDDTFVITCKDHLWKINYRLSRKESTRQRNSIRTTEHIQNDLKFSGRIPIYKNRIDFVSPINFPEKDLPVDPYVLGKYLSNLSYNDNVVKNSQDALSTLDKTWKESWKDDWNKRFIKKEFLYTSVLDRVRLLKGLMNQNQIILSSSDELTENVKFLVESLGSFCYIVKDKDLNITKISAVILNKNIRWILNIKEYNKPTYKTIVNVVECGEGECTCIQVDSSDSLFLTNDFILTHNTTISLQYAAYAQTHFGAKVFYFNVEGRLSRLVLSQIQNLSLAEDMFEVISAAPITKGDKVIGTKKLSGEDWWNEIGLCIQNNPGAVIIVDSIANMSSEKEFSENMGHQDRGGKNKLESQFCRKYGDLVSPMEITLFLLTHIMANTSGYGAPFQAKVGNDIKHQADIILFGKSMKKWDEVNGKVLGHNMIYTVEASAMGPPNVEIEVPLRYGFGCDNVTDIITFCINYDIISKSGSWFLLPFDENGKEPEDEKNKMKVQGQANIWNLLVADTTKKDLLYTALSKKLLL